MVLQCAMVKTIGGAWEPPPPGGFRQNERPWLLGLKETTTMATLDLGSFLSLKKFPPLLYKSCVFMYITLEYYLRNKYNSTFRVQQLLVILLEYQQLCELSWKDLQFECNHSFLAQILEQICSYEVKWYCWGKHKMDTQLSSIDMTQLFQYNNSTKF